MKCISTIIRKLEKEVEQKNKDCDVAVMLGELKSFDYTAELSDKKLYYFRKELKKDNPHGYKNYILFSTNNKKK